MKVDLKGPIVDDMTGWFYDWLEMDSCYPKKIAKALEEADGEEIILEINSNGGMCTPAFDMYKMLMDYEGKTTAHITTACSAATLIACGADETLMSDAAIFMIHNSQSYAEGDYRDMEMEADALKEFNAAIINIYQRKTGMNGDELQALMDTDTYMSPQKAIELGFADGWIYGEPKKNSEPIIAVAAVEQIISPKKAKEMFEMMHKKSGKGFTERVIDNVDIPDIAENGGNVFQNKETINSKENGGTTMDLNQFLADNPEAQAELDKRIEDATKDAVNAARAEGAAEERERIKALDEIAHGVTAEALNDAKYGDICDAKELSYRAMKDEKLRMAQYMAEAITDTLLADDVSAEPSEEETVSDGAMLASIVNKKKEGK